MFYTRTERAATYYHSYTLTVLLSPVQRNGSDTLNVLQSEWGSERGWGGVTRAVPAQGRGRDYMARK